MSCLFLELIKCHGVVRALIIRENVIIIVNKIVLLFAIFIHAFYL